MQANGTAHDHDAEVSRRNGTQNGESQTTGPSHSNVLTANNNNNGNPLTNINNHQQSATNKSNSASDGVKNKKRLSQCEEDGIRLIGQHLHDLGLK